MFVIFASFMLPLCVFAQDVEQQRTSFEKTLFSLDKEFGRGSIQSQVLAEMALEKAEQTQISLQSFLQDAEMRCQEKFFVNVCLDDLKLQRRMMQDTLRRINVEAKSFLRKVRLVNHEDVHMNETSKN